MRISPLRRAPLCRTCAGVGLIAGDWYASIWDAIEDTPEQAENMKLRASLMMALAEHIRSEGLSQSEAAKRFGVTQPRVSDLVRGKVQFFGLDALVNMSAAARLHIEMTVAKAA